MISLTVGPFLMDVLFNYVVFVSDCLVLSVRFVLGSCITSRLMVGGQQAVAYCDSFAVFVCWHGPWLWPFSLYYTMFGK